MNWDRWREVIRLFYRLDAPELLRAHTPPDRWYLIDRLLWSIGVIERVGEIEAQGTLSLPMGGDDDDGIAESQVNCRSTPRRA
jgi:hypothetical protein